jgi:hypothetical protein
MAKILTLELPDELEQSLEAQATQQSTSVENLILEWLTQLAQPTTQAEADPLAALLGTLSAEVSDIGEHHDVYLGDSLQHELKNAQ